MQVLILSAARQEARFVLRALAFAVESREGGVVVNAAGAAKSEAKRGQVGSSSSRISGKRRGGSGGGSGSGEGGSELSLAHELKTSTLQTLSPKTRCSCMLPDSQGPKASLGILAPAL